MMGKPVCLLCMNVSRSEIIASIRTIAEASVCGRVCERQMMPVVCPFCAGMKVRDKKGVNSGCGERILQFGPDVISAEVTAHTKSLGTDVCCGS